VLVLLYRSRSRMCGYKRARLDEVQAETPSTDRTARVANDLPGQLIPTQFELRLANKFGMFLVQNVTTEFQLRSLLPTRNRYSARALPTPR